MITMRELAETVSIFLKQKRLKADRATICMSVYEAGYDYNKFTERAKRNLSIAVKKYIQSN